MNEFCTEVGRIAAEYGVDDGADLCYTLIELGVVNMADGAETAARTVAQCYLQA